MSPIHWAVQPFRQYATAEGRAPRPEFWWFLLLLVLLHIGGWLVELALGLGAITLDLGPIRLLLALLTFIPVLCVAARRLHDTNRSGWWVGAYWLISAIGNGVLVALQRSDPTLEGTAAGVTSLLVLFAVIVLLVLLALPGTKGPNDYGPDPRDDTDFEEVFG